MTDYKSIVPRALDGDAAAFDELYRSTCRAVYFTCVSLLKNAQDAEDMTQNTYITAFAKLKTLENPERFEPWIKRIAANLCKDFLIKKGAHPSEPLDEETFEEVDENFLPEEYAEASEKREIVMKIMRETLSDTLYRTVILFYFDELTIAEIAEEMDCPVGTVKYRLNAARAKIKKGVLDYEKKSGDKLYALVGVPFLALLLSRQAEAASVPVLDIMSVITQNSPYVPDSTAVDPNFANSAANTARRIGGKMFGTLKAKIIAGACAAAILGGGVTAGVIIANNAKKKPVGGYTSRMESELDPTSKTNIWGNISEPVHEDYKYVDIEGGIRITKYIGNDEILTVPAEIDGKKVLEIDNDIENNLFTSYDYDKEVNIKEITLPDGMTRIGNLTFSYLYKLKTIHIPDSITVLGDGAFQSCESLENVTLPDGLTKLSYTFIGCKSLSDITIPESVRELFCTFEYCTSLTHISIPTYVDVMEGSFEGCTNLKEVIFLGTELEKIGFNTFRNCTSLESIVVPNGVKSIAELAFDGCTSLKSITLPDTLEEIEANAFEGCTSLKEIVLPDGMRSIEPSAFKDCTDIKIIFKGNSFTPDEIIGFLGSID
ncbi:MAG: sigma-70 family RNA polymerase sigma factor [Oscillospiraceae bacterium]|nr:sigma-70 family RNA polymerase sigma factor [Oscillospiraceae bacterium]